MSRRPRLLDLFACQGGASAGYQAAGFEVTAVDLDARALARNPADHTVQADALVFLAAHGHEFDAVHASPPCQDHSQVSSYLPPTRGTAHLLPDTLDALRLLGRPWAVENVAGAAGWMPGASVFCGYAFGLRECRHRLFLSSELLLTAGCAVPGRSEQLPAREREVFGHHGNCDRVRADWDVPWMSQHGMAQAIPPVFAEHVGVSLLAATRLAA